MTKKFEKKNCSSRINYYVSKREKRKRDVSFTMFLKLDSFWFKDVAKNPVKKLTVVLVQQSKEISVCLCMSKSNLYVFIHFLTRKQFYVLYLKSTTDPNVSTSMLACSNPLLIASFVRVSYKMKEEQKRTSNFFSVHCETHFH